MAFVVISGFTPGIKDTPAYSFLAKKHYDKKWRIFSGKFL